jgi:hypothetical protein
MPGLSSPKRGPSVIHVGSTVPATAHDLDSRSEGCDSKRSGDVFKAGGAELLKVILHQRPLDHRVRRPQFEPHRPIAAMRESQTRLSS